MKDKLCVDELKQSIAASSEPKLKPGHESLVTLKCTFEDRESTFMVKTVYQIDRLKYDEDRGEWVRLDHSVTYESRFLHCLTDMSIVSNKLIEISER